MATLTTINTMSEQEALVVLSDESKAKEVIETVRKLATSEVLNANKPADRKRMRSLAAAVAKSKTLLDGHGKKLVEPIKAQAKAIDANRKLIRDELDAIRDEVKQPAIDFDNAERERQENHNAAIQYINSLSDQRDEYGNDYDSGQLKASLEEAEQIQVSVEHCEEFAPDYAKAKAEAISRLKQIIAEVERREAEAQELEELRQLKAQKEREEYEAKLKAETAEQARLAEIERQKQVEAKTKAELEAREANKRHCSKINTEVKNAIVTLGVDNALAKHIVNAIAKGMIPNVTINY